jgi:hypothetical protein
MPVKQWRYRFDYHRRDRESQHTRAATADRLDPLADCLGMVQQAAALSQQLLTLWRQSESATNAIEELDPKLSLQLADLAR